MGHLDRRDAVTLARQVAVLLPGPPVAEDRTGTAAWAELVRSAVVRLAARAGTEPLDPAAVRVPRRILSAQELAVLAGVAIFADLDTLDAAQLTR